MATSVMCISVQFEYEHPISEGRHYVKLMVDSNFYQA